MPFERKITIYQTNSDRPIIITEEKDDTPLEILRDKLLDILNSNGVVSLQTSNDFFMIRAESISAIMLTAKGEFHKLTRVKADFSKITTPAIKPKISVPAVKPKVSSPVQKLAEVCDPVESPIEVCDPVETQDNTSEPSNNEYDELLIVEDV